jgi:hypothetical protein
VTVRVAAREFDEVPRAEVVGVVPAGAEVDDDPATEVVVLEEAAFGPEEHAAAVRATAARISPSAHRFEPVGRGAGTVSRRFVGV